MPGLTDLVRLLTDLAPVLNRGGWVFVSVKDLATAESLQSICTFAESEGVTAICLRDRAALAKLNYDGVFSQITLNVYSSLHAVGLIAAVAELLRKSAIPCNVVSALHHDHLFVPVERAKQALELLQKLGSGGL